MLSSTSGQAAVGVIIRDCGAVEDKPVLTAASSLDFGNWYGL